MDKDPYAFEGPFAITPATLWLAFYRMVDLNNKPYPGIKQDIVLAPAGAEGMEILQKIYHDVLPMVFAISLDQLRQASEYLKKAETPGSASSVFPSWFPRLSRPFVIVFEKNGKTGAVQLEAISAASAMAQFQKENQGTLIACGSRADLSKALEELETVFSGNLEPISSDFRMLSDSGKVLPYMWLHCAKSPWFRKTMEEQEQELSEIEKELEDLGGKD